MTTVLFLDLGHMGGPMAANLAGAGHRVLGFDIVPAALEAARAAGVETVTDTAVAAAAADNARLATGDDWGPVGLVVGATVADRAAALGVDLADLRGALLAPGYGAQGATAAGMRDGFGRAWPQVLATSSRDILRQGPEVGALTRAIEAARAELTAA